MVSFLSFMQALILETFLYREQFPNCEEYVQLCVKLVSANQLKQYKAMSQMLLIPNFRIGIRKNPVDLLDVEIIANKVPLAFNEFFNGTRQNWRSMEISSSVNFLFFHTKHLCYSDLIQQYIWDYVCTVRDKVISQEPKIVQVLNRIKLNQME